MGEEEAAPGPIPSSMSIPRLWDSQRRVRAMTSLLRRSTSATTEPGLSITNSISAIRPRGSVGWLSVDPISGTSSGGSVGHQVSVATEGLEPGLHPAILLVTGNAPNSPFEIPVNLTVGSGPLITVNPTDFIFTAFEGSVNPSGRSLIVGSQGETLLYEVSSNQPWLTVEPTGGNTLAAPGIHTVRVDTDGLTAGTFLGKLTIDSPSATNAPLTLDVTLSINPPGSLTTFPSSVSFFGAAGTPVTTHRIVSLAGALLSGVAWEAAVDPPEQLGSGLRRAVAACREI